MQMCRLIVASSILFAMAAAVGCGASELKQDPVKVQEETKTLSTMSKDERSK